MSAICLIRHPEDAAFTRDTVLPPLPALGFDRLFTPLDAASLGAAIKRSTAVLVVLSAEAALATEFLATAEAALRSRTPVIVVHRSAPEDTSPLLQELSHAAAIDLASSAQPEELWRSLARLLPTPPDPVESPNGGRPLDWNSKAFTVLLTQAAGRDDFAFVAALIDTLVAHLGRHDEPYPADAARADLKVLRNERQFLLMGNYAAAVIKSGTADFEVRRQYGQALIELKDVDAAVDVLRALAAATPEGHEENYEARGLLGRAYKQRYIDAGAEADPEWLAAAILEYWKAFVENRSLVWHGINAASLLLRADRDDVPVPVTDSPVHIAEQVLTVLNARQNAARDKLLDVWDYATRVEAYLDLGMFEQARASLDDYLTHPEMRPFEVSSTYRQFDEVLQLRDSADGRLIADRLLEAATRLRAGGHIGTADAEGKRFLVRVSDPDWAPSDVPDLTIGTRLGTIVSIAGSADTIDALLKDPLVISIEASRPAGGSDGERSLQFVHVQDTYQDDTGTYTEQGAQALVAIIDDGIDVLHEAFLDEDGESRIIGVWDQTDPGPDPSSAVDFGRFHTAVDIAGYVRSGDVPARLLQRGCEHGTHVASIAAGRRCGAFAGGVAPDARLLIVISNATEPTGYSEAHLAALKFIDTTATSLGLPVVVNVSQGMNAGAHDGQSSLEIGFDRFCGGGRTPGRIVVKSAGNERSKRGHAKLTVPPGGADDLVWHCPAGMSRTVKLELWWNHENEYRFQLRSPRDEFSEWVDRKQPVVEEYFRRQGDYRLELVPSHIDNGDKLLRVQITCGNSDRAEPDKWSLVVEAVQVCIEGDIHAWIERDGGPLTEFFGHDTEEMTLSVPGTARSVISVGAVDATLPVRVGSFSSFGPTRDRLKRPDVCAPGVGVKAARARSKRDVVAMDGTSMAAPHVTGAVALLLSRAFEQGVSPPTATQVRSLLHRNTMFSNAFWDRGQGYGVLDVKKLLEVGLPSLL
jgi:endonuclease G